MFSLLKRLKEQNYAERAVARADGQAFRFHAEKHQAGRPGIRSYKPVAC
jgi:hypothetical protein